MRRFAAVYFDEDVSVLLARILNGRGFNALTTGSQIDDHPGTSLSILVSKLWPPCMMEAKSYENRLRNRSAAIRNSCLKRVGLFVRDARPAVPNGLDCERRFHWNRWLH